MPKGVVKTPEQERLWDKAKALAAKEGRAGDYAYIMGIFKKMGGMSKSLSESSLPGFMARVGRRMRVPGQVVEQWRQSRELEKLVSRKPKEPTLADHFATTRLSPAAVLDGMGLSPGDYSSWHKFLETAIEAPNEVVLRKDVLARAREERMPVPQRQALLDRTMGMWRNMRKSMCKALYIGPKGGRWADPEHTIPYKEAHKKEARGQPVKELPVPFVTTITPPKGSRMLGGQPTKLYGLEAKGDYYVLSTEEHPTNEFNTFKVPKVSMKQWAQDMAGKVDVPKTGNPAVDAVIDGKAEYLGQGDDGIAFRVGDKVVKVSSVVEYHPDRSDRTPQEAMAQLKAQVAMVNQMVDDGVPGLQRSEYIESGDKGFEVKDWVEIPEQFTRDQLDDIQRSMLGAHEKGYAFHDEIQAGLDKDGRPVMFDTGKAVKVDPKKAQDNIYGDFAVDRDNLALLYRKHGVDFYRLDQSDADRKWGELTDWDKLDEYARGGKGDLMRRRLEQVSGMLREEAKAKAKGGKELLARLSEIKKEHESALELLEMSEEMAAEKSGGGVK